MKDYPLLLHPNPRILCTSLCYFVYFFSDSVVLTCLLDHVINLSTWLFSLLFVFLFIYVYLHA
jgi:hypothetical protein